MPSMHRIYKIDGICNIDVTIEHIFIETNGYNKLLKILNEFTNL